MPQFTFNYRNSVTITTFYKTCGDIHSSPPLIFLHGGPGAGCEDQYPLAEPLAAAGIPSIHYDQVGCGRSSRLREMAEKPSFWTFELFCAQLDCLIDELGVREKGFFLHGQSWGGMLASTYSARRPKGLRKLVIANSPSSAAVFEREIMPLFKALPVSEEVLRLEKEEQYRDPVYEEALARFAKKHFCLLDPWPDVLNGTVCKESTNMVLMWGIPGKGVCRTRITGPLKDYDATVMAREINVPTLLLSGRHDFITDGMMKPWFDLIPKVKWAVLENSSHMSSLEEPERYLELLNGFLSESDERGHPPAG